jgi:DNA polymerase-3 subunit delta'
MWQLRGHDPLLRQLNKSFSEGRYAHAYLLVGPAQVGKRTLAINMAQAVNCLSTEDIRCGECDQCRHIASAQHADVRLIGVQRDGEDGPQRRDIGIGDVREVQHQASLKPYEGKHRVFIFDGAERMSEDAANALLKTLEEPPPQVMIILLASHEEALLPTIRSRCRRLELRPLPMAEVAKELVGTHSADEKDAETLARLSLGCLGWAISALKESSIMERRADVLDHVSSLSKASLEDRFNYASELASTFSQSREDARENLYLWLRWWRDLLLLKEGTEDFIYNLDWADSLRDQAAEYTTVQIVGFIRGILSVLDALEDNGNVRLALEVLMLGLPERTRSHSAP